MLIYLDNAATTQPIYGDVSKIHQNGGWFNPSAAYSGAADVFVGMKEVRQKLLETTGIDGGVIFTSGGTEANNIVINSAVRKNAHYITSAVEHPSVFQVFAQLRQAGAEVDYIKPKGFCIDPEDVVQKVKENTALVSIMHVNNETGALNDIRTIAAKVKAKSNRTLFHSDGVQALQKAETNLSGSEVDFYTVSAHKINGLKGTGAVIAKNTAKLKPLMYGGGQEDKIRPGTENTLGIQVLGEALKLEYDVEKTWQLRGRLISGIEEIDDCVVNVPKAYVPHIVSVSFPGLRAEVLVRLMGENGIYIGTGAACSKGKLSRVLLESGIERRLAEGTVRISFGRNNTLEEVDICLEEMKNAAKSLRRLKRN